MNQDTTPKTPIGQTFVFRAFTVYLTLFFVFISDFISELYYKYPVLRDINTPFQYISGAWVRLVNQLFLHQRTPITLDVADNYWDWVRFLTFIILAILIALVWTIIDKGKRPVPFYKYMYAVARYYLAFVLMEYAIVKLDMRQFSISPYALLMRLGYGGSFQVFRAFCGISRSYMFFGGLIETVPAILLLFRRTATLGALVATLALSNVLMLNVGYDIWLKIWVFNLILFSIFILVPDIKKLAQIFVLKQNASLSVPPPVIESKKYAWLRYALKISLIGVVVFALVKEQTDEVQEAKGLPYNNMVGVHEIREFSQTSLGKQPAVDSLQWTSIAINPVPEMDVFLKNDSWEWFSMKVDTLKKTVDLKLGSDSTYKGTLHYTNIKPGLWLFEGKLKNDSIRFVTKRTDMYDMPVMKGYGHVKWIN